MKKPNIREASEDYSKLANALKNEENYQYAALCFSAMAKLASQVQSFIACSNLCPPLCLCPFVDVIK